MLMFAERTCAKCGKVFIPAPQHALVDNKGAYCSCACFLHRKDGRDGRGRKGYRVMQFTKDGEHVKTYDSARIAGELFGVSANDICEYCRSGRPYHGFIWKYAKDAEKELDDGRG